MIKIYRHKSFAHTPFANKKDLEYLYSNGIEMTENIDVADVIVCQNIKHIKKLFLKYLKTKKYLIWTLEPRFDTCFKSERNGMFGLWKCHVMNVYTQDVFVSNLTFHTGIINKKLNHIPEGFILEHRKIAALISYYKGIDTPQLIRGNKNIDLIKLRSQIALEGLKLGVLDIFGKGWPVGISNEDSRDGDWGNRKSQLLIPYNFNLCFENTIAFNYTTEKIWDSIANYCLPIYFGAGTNIYSIFPKKSFLDYAEFKNAKELFDYIANMEVIEYSTRMNACIDVYNSISSKGEEFIWEKRKEALDKIIEKINRLTK